ncbi:MAG: glycosyltransferase, partial [Deltaproteobacteria bacterium]|nr:glycosyltransferase [Deltaproteobacteria bacterium]
MSRPQDQYLDRYAEPEARKLGPLRRRFGHVLTIPAYGEGRELVQTLESIPAGALGDVLTVLVVNGRADAPASMQEANIAVLERLRANGGRGIPLAVNAAVHEHPRGALLVVDRATPGRELPPRHGVGLARKIAADIALALWSEGNVASPWIHCTDADAVLPSDYFEAAAAEVAGDSDAALLYPFRHTGATREALEYEISLRYYVAGLRFAGSPYAFHTIGSTLAIHALAYARVRGFPKRLAGEDFYLLNKLAKVGAIRSLGGEPIRLSARASKRTPFGTGRALERARGPESGIAPLRVYHPDVFSDLGAWLQTLDALAETGIAAAPAEPLAERIGAWPCADARRLRA